MLICACLWCRVYQSRDQFISTQESEDMNSIEKQQQ